MADIRTTNGLPIRFIDKGPIGDTSRGRYIDAVTEWKGKPMVLITFRGYHARFEDRYLTLYPFKVWHGSYMKPEKLKIDLCDIESTAKK